MGAKVSTRDKGRMMAPTVGRPFCSVRFPRSIRTWVENGLRHSFCAQRLAKNNNAVQVVLEAGNNSSMIFPHGFIVTRPGR